jgi:hypothetical protein
MNNQEILDNAPEGATSYAEFVIVELNTYCKKWGGEHRFWDETLNTWINQGWKQLSSRANFRSLSDIKRIVELEKERDQILNSALNSESNYCALKDSMPVHNLEQQAKGVNGAIETCEKYDPDDVGEEVITVVDLGGYRLGLEYKAKALKDQG